MLKSKLLVVLFVFPLLMLCLLLPLHLLAAPQLQTKLPTATAAATPTATVKSTRPTATPTATPIASKKNVTATVQSQASETVSKTTNAISATISPTLDASNGPAFDWSTSENYLILGTDRREGWNDWRTDSIMLVGFDRANERAAVFSIPRDLYVKIPGYGMGRINQVDFMGEQHNGAGGGPLLISQVLSETLGVSAQHWLRVQMDGFVRFVDAVGGVTVTLDCPFAEPIYNLTTQSWDEFTLPAGDNLLDGDSAYWFVRLRLRESDIGRSNRQRQFLWALRNKVTSTNLLLRAPELWQAFNGTFSTDLDFLQLLDLGSFSLRLQPQNVRASGLTLADLENFVTENGQMVLRVGNQTHVRSKLANVWAAPAMIDSNRHSASTCQPLPDPSALNLPSVSVDGANSAGQNPISSTSSSPTSAVTTQPAQQPVTDLVVGNRVRLRRGVMLSVRSKPGETVGREFGTWGGGEEAVIIGGPSPVGGVTWWYVRTDSGLEGWIAGNTSEFSLLQVVQ